MTEIQFAKQFLTTLDSKNAKYQPDHIFDQKTFAVRTPYTLPKLQHPPHPLLPKTTISAPGSLPTSNQDSDTTSSSSGPTITLTLKSTRNPTFTLHLPFLPLSTPIATLRTTIQPLISSAGPVPVDKIKILHNKKPIPPTKVTLEDVVSLPPDSTAPGPVSETQVEFSVMVMGGAPDPEPAVQTIHLSNASASTPAPKPQTTKVPSQPPPSISTNPTSDPVQPGAPSGHEILSTQSFWDDLQGFLEQRLKDTAEAKRVRGVFEEAVKGQR